jgi:rod shape determining protein RodA
MATIASPRPVRPITAASRARENADLTPVRHVDALLIGLPFVLSLFGMLMIYSSTRLHYGRYFVERQGIAVVIGVVAMFVMMKIDYRRFREWYPMVYIAMIPLLLAVLVVGSRVNGATAWIQVGPLQFQPSEVVKIGIIIAIAGYCHQYRGDLDAWRVAIVVALGLVPIALVLLQNDLGSAFVIGIALCAVLLVAGVRRSHMIVLALLALSAVIAAVASGYLAGYQLDRLKTFASGDTHVTKSATPTEYSVGEGVSAIASGGLTGSGLYHGTATKLGYVPEQRTDFIFTAVGEQFGFLGSATLILLYALLIWRVFRVGLLSSDFFGTLVCMGVLAVLAFQVFENIGMTLKIMPVTGIPLPFLSYGGSSVIATFAALGIVANVHMRRFS